MKTIRNHLHASEVDYSQLVIIRDNKIAGMRIGVHRPELVHLEMVEIPHRLAKDIFLSLRNTGLQRLAQRLPLKPVHGQYPLTTEFGIIMGKNHIRYG